MHQETYDGEEPKLKYKIRLDEVLVPLSIFVSAVLISASILYTGSGSKFGLSGGGTKPSGDSPAAAAPSDAPSPDNIKPVSSEDHILGNPSAPVVIVEYSDIDCEFCKQYQEALEQIITD